MGVAKGLSVVAKGRWDEMLSAATWSGAGMSVVGALTVVQWLAVGGFVLAVAGFCVNFWHKTQMIKLARERLDKEYPDG
ncbi:MAG: hypothetical protein JKY50_00145 [Oleispira sp.]|nr:hypothetical protein [Oleispira sp.]